MQTPALTERLIVLLIFGVTSWCAGLFLFRLKLGSHANKVVWTFLRSPGIFCQILVDRTDYTHSRVLVCVMHACVCVCVCVCVSVCVCVCLCVRVWPITILCYFFVFQFWLNVEPFWFLVNVTDVVLVFSLSALSLSLSLWSCFIFTVIDADW